MTAAVSSGGAARGTKAKRKIPGDSVRETFVERSEDWIRKIAAELPVEYLQHAMSEKSAPEDLLQSVTEFASGDVMHRALLLRYVRAVDQMVRRMPGDLLMSTISAPSDFGALARAMSDPRVSSSTRETDPLAGAVGRSIAHRSALMEMAGEMLSSSQVEELLGIRRQAIDKRRQAHKLLAVRMASDWAYPTFQFGREGVLPGLEDVLQAYAESDPWVVLDILVAPDDALHGRSLIQAIQEGDEHAIAHHVRQASGDGFS